MDPAPLSPEHRQQFIRDMQESFRPGAAGAPGGEPEEVLPAADIEEPLSPDGAAASEALADGGPAGGAVTVISRETQHNRPDFLFIKAGFQGRGTGKAIRSALEARFPDTMVRETCTPYFEKRNIHFYVNVRGFCITEFFNQRHPDPDDPGGCPTAGHEFFRPEKEMMRDTGPAL